MCESEEYISTIKTQINMRSLTGQSFVLAWHPILLLRKMNQIKSERGVGGVGGGDGWEGRDDSLECEAWRGLVGSFQLVS